MKRSKIAGLLTLPQCEAIRGIRERAFAHTVMDRLQYIHSVFQFPSCNVDTLCVLKVWILIFHG